jgi:tetratricopeptide (TPR) repeat protein
LLGRGDDAQQLAERAMETSIAQHGFRAHVLQLIGDIAIAADRRDVDASEVHNRRALALAEPRGMRPLVARCHLGLARCYGRSGAHEKAREYNAKAAALCRDLGMTFWLQRADDPWP